MDPEPSIHGETLFRGTDGRLSAMRILFFALLVAAKLSGLAWLVMWLVAGPDFADAWSDAIGVSGATRP